MERPETRYAGPLRGRIAYKVYAGGPVDVLVTTPPWLPIDLIEDEPRVVRYLERLSRFCRHAWFDPRGRGASDPLEQVEDRLVENMVDDMVVVLDELGWQQAAVLNLGLGGLLCAATHPGRVQALILAPAITRFRRAPDYPGGWSDEGRDLALAMIEQEWGTGKQLHALAPRAAADPQLGHWFSKCERLSSSPRLAAERAAAVFDLDMRQALPVISVPTLVIDHRDSFWMPTSRYAAEHIDGARYLELPGGGELFFTGDTEPILDVVEEFLTGHLPEPDTDRILATVLFTDVVGSTEQAARLGDRRWRELLADHNTAVRRELGRHRGREIKTIGDGFLATFDGPGRAIRCACAIQESVRPLNIELRAGLHTGEIELLGEDIGGIAVHIGQRVASRAGPGEVLVSSTVRDLVVGSEITFDDRGEHELKGVPGSWKLFAVRG